jgi:queuine tRNA-ribosyltransferase
MTNNFYMIEPSPFSFTLIHQSTKSSARVGIINTPHGPINTPGFVPVATNGCIKGLDSISSLPTNIELLFCNTYHLMLHPGTETVAQAGGLHTFMNRHQPIITDSGGFQIFSLMYGGVHQELKSKGTKKQDGSVLKITDDGVLFRSYRDGSLITLTPESSVQAQKQLGADIIIPLDELPPYHTTPDQLKKSLARTHNWETRSLHEHRKNINNQAMYAVIHGGIDDQLRAHSAAYLTSLPFDGFAIGGSLGKTREQMVTMLTKLIPQLPNTHPRHLLGIADMPSLDNCIPLGIDTFDSAYPTKCARHGLLLMINQPAIKILQTVYKQQHLPIDPTCTCLACTHYTRGYLHHLFKAHELTAYTLATIHNITTMSRLMHHYRQQILNDEI